MDAQKLRKHVLVLTDLYDYEEAADEEQKHLSADEMAGIAFFLNTYADDDMYECGACSADISECYGECPFCGTEYSKEYTLEEVSDISEKVKATDKLTKEERNKIYEDYFNKQEKGDEDNEGE